MLPFVFLCLSAIFLHGYDKYCSYTKRSDLSNVLLDIVLTVKNP